MITLRKPPRATTASWIHAAVLLFMAVAACGGGAGGAPPPQVAPGPSASGGIGLVAPGASAGAGAPGGGLPGPGASASTSSPLSPAAAVEMKPVLATAMVDDLRALGLDAGKLPPIEKLEPRTLRGVMKLMAKSLGVKCGDCHQEGDFAAPTRRKRIAAHMWDEFAAKLELAGTVSPASAESPVFCDSCHQGRVQLLDRRDKKALSQWMDETFVTKLDRHDRKSVECETCHVDMDMHFLAKWGQ